MADIATRANGFSTESLGTYFRLESKKVTGFALTFDELILHPCILARGNG